MAELINFKIDLHVHLLDVTFHLVLSLFDFLDANTDFLVKVLAHN